MDLIMGLPHSDSKKNAIWVIIDRLTKFAYILPIHDTWGIERLAQLYVKEIACVLDFQGKWEEYLPLVEFSYNNNY